MMNEREFLAFCERMDYYDACVDAGDIELAAMEMESICLLYTIEEIIEATERRRLLQEYRDIVDGDNPDDEYEMDRELDHGTVRDNPGRLF